MACKSCNLNIITNVIFLKICLFIVVMIVALSDLVSCFKLVLHDCKIPRNVLNILKSIFSFGNYPDRKPDWDGTGVLDLSKKRTVEEPDEPLPPNTTANESHMKEIIPSKSSEEVTRSFDMPIQG